MPLFMPEDHLGHHGFAVSSLAFGGYFSVEVGYTYTTPYEAFTDPIGAADKIGGYYSTAWGEGEGAFFGGDFVVGAHEAETFEGESNVTSGTFVIVGATVSEAVQDAGGLGDQSLADTSGVSSSVGFGGGLGLAEGNAETHHYTLNEALADRSFAAGDDAARTADNVDEAARELGEAAARTADHLADAAEHASQAFNDAADAANEARDAVMDGVSHGLGQVSDAFSDTFGLPVGGDVPPSSPQEPGAGPGLPPSFLIDGVKDAVDDFADSVPPSFLIDDPAGGAGASAPDPHDSTGSGQDGG